MTRTASSSAHGCLPACTAAPASPFFNLCLQPSLPAAMAATVAGLGGLLAANPAAASELLSNAGAFIPGIVGDDPVR